ncbi:MAG: host attachment protein [Bacteroidetes bacterium]|nr:host attachment protein [Bacteroidota bacterium]
MKKVEVIITANFGALKAYRIEEKSLVHRRGCELIRKTEYERAHKKLSEIVTDRAGRFRGSGVATNKNRSFGEEHHLADDLKQKAVKQIAHDIDGVIKHTPANGYYLAVPKAISKDILDRLSAATRSKITKRVDVDIVKEPVQAIRDRFKV